jgi:hypothetical protein
MKCNLQNITCLVLATVAIIFSANIANSQTKLPGHLNKDKSCHINDESRRLLNAAKMGTAPDNLRFKGGEIEGVDLTCNFFERAAQMFLWLTSPISRSKRTQGGFQFAAILQRLVCRRQDSRVYADYA